MYSILLLLSWLANPAFWYGVYLLARRRWRGVLRAGTVALLLGLSGKGLGLPEFEDLEGGYYAWLASMALLTAVGLSGVLRE